MPKKKRHCTLVVRCTPGAIAALDNLAYQGESRAAAVRRIIRDQLVRLLGERATKDIFATKVVPTAPWRIAHAEADHEKELSEASDPPNDDASTI